MTRVTTARKSNLLRDMDTPETVAVYDSLMNKKSYFNYLARRIVKRCGTKGKLLDVGCGPGHLLIALGKNAPELKLFGVDISSNMLETADKHLAQQLPGRSVELKEGSMYGLPYGDDSFDLVVCSNVIHMSDDLVGLFNEMYRIMKPGGTGLAIGYRRDEPRWVWAITHAHSKWLARNGKPLDGAGPVLEASYTAIEVAELLDQSTVTEFQIEAGRYLLYTELNK